MNDDRPLDRSQKLWLALECFGLFVAAPVGGSLARIPLAVIPMLLVMALACGLALHLHYGVGWREMLLSQAPKQEWRRVMGIFVIALPLLLTTLWLIKPEALFSLVRQHPGFWLLLMAAYPLLSVIPQELIYRAFFFRRYRALFGESYCMVFVSAVLFSLGHLLFHNWIAVALSFIGGCLFGRTYQRTSSLPLTAVEHSLYGCAVFTVGYGAFFLDDTLRAFK
jgi:membrane protease YdiL (CAAX protease family)